jgi:hypothetical protein
MPIGKFRDSNPDMLIQSHRSAEILVTPFSTRGGSQIFSINYVAAGFSTEYHFRHGEFPHRFAITTFRSSSGPKNKARNSLQTLLPPYFERWQFRGFRPRLIVDASSSRHFGPSVTDVPRLLQIRTNRVFRDMICCHQVSTS